MFCRGPSASGASQKVGRVSGCKSVWKAKDSDFSLGQLLCSNRSSEGRL